MIRKIVLVNPYFQKYTQAIAQISVGPPLGLAYLAAVLEERGFIPEIIDANAEKLSEEEIIDRLIQSKADLIGFTAVTPTIDMCARIAGSFKEKLPHVPIVIGGVHATVLPQESMTKYPVFDFLVRGEGEYVLSDLVDVLNNKSDLTKIESLCFRNSSGIVINPLGDRIQDLDSIPFPARHLLPRNVYRTFDSDKMTTVIAMRGCPGLCVYCAVKLISGEKCRKRSPSNVIEEIKLCKSKYGVDFVGFLDDTFTFDPDWVHNLCDAFIKSGLNIRWSCLTRVDNVSRDLLKHMKEAGCIRVEFGIESGSPKILDYLRKGITLSQIKQAFALAKGFGLSTMGFVILNTPGETKTDILETQRLVMEVDPDFLQASFATPYPGTELYKRCLEEGVEIEDDWSKYIFLNQHVIKNKFISEEELDNLMRQIQRSFYLRPRYLLKIIKYMCVNPGSRKTIIWAGKNAFNKLLRFSQLNAKEWQSTY